MSAMPENKGKTSLTWVLLKARPLLRYAKGFRGTPEAIAGGLSLGLFLALTPSLGFQLIIAVFLATIMKISRPAALVGVMVTNPVTVPPIFTFNYWVGSLIFPGPSVTDVYGRMIALAKEMAAFNVWEVGAQARLFLETGRDMLLPLVAGSMLVAVIVGVVSYFVVVKFLRLLFRHRRRSQDLSGE